MQLSPRQPTTKGPDEWFSGDVYVDAIARHQGNESVSLGVVHFAPCAHTAWHRHSLGQTLYCTDGEGFVQARGGPLIKLRPGDVVVTAPNEWHWHGGTTDRFMVHVALTGGDTEWGDHLTNDEYPPSSSTEQAHTVDMT